MFERGTGGDFVAPPSDVYTLRFDGVIQERTWPNKRGPGGTPDPNYPDDKSLQLRFFIEDDGQVDEQWIETEIRAWFPARFTPGNKTGKLFAAMFGGVLPNEFAGTEEELRGRRVRATIGQDEKGYIEVTSPLPARSRRGQQELPKAMQTTVMPENAYREVLAGTEPPF